MSANLFTVTRKLKRELPMKKLLMPITTLTTLKKMTFTLLCCTVLMVVAASAQTVILQENFDELPQATAVTSAGAFTAINGTNVDIVGPTNFPGLCVAPESGNCLDLDGSGGDSQGDIESGLITLNPGITYTLSFDLIGSQRGDVGTSTTVSFGPYSNTFNLASTDDTSGIVSVQITVSSTTTTYLQFQSNTPGNVGALLDNVLITATATTQEMLTVTELGTGIGTVTDSTGAIGCSEANGYPPTAVPPGSCAALFPNGTTVQLTAYPSTAQTYMAPEAPPTANGSTFLGWLGAACALPSGAINPSTSCSVTMGSAQTVTADFAPTPAPAAFTINAGTNVIAQETYACPSGATPCTDPNAYGFSMQFPVVSTSFSPFDIVATEVYADGICPGGQVLSYGSGFPTGPTTDFDCRFVYTFNYGTTDAAGDTVVPLCDAYANGNCVHFDVYYQASGSPPPPADFTGPLFETFSFSNSTISPGSYWAGSTTRAIIDPDVASEASSNPSAPYGTSCTTPMGGTPEGTTIYCQFDADITAFIDTGGTSKNISDFVVAFQPSPAGAASIPNPSGLQPPTPEPPTITGNCLTSGCSVSDPTITFTEGTGGTFQVSVSVTTPPVYPAPNLTASTTGTTTTASESGGTVTLTAPGTFGSQSLVGDMVVVSNCTPTGYNGTFPILSATTGSGGTTLTYADTATGLAGGGTGCDVLVLPNGLTYNGSTGLVSGTPQDGTAGSYPITFIANNGVTPAPNNTLSYTLTVNPAGTLSIAASNGTMTYGGTLPTISPIITGAVNGDNATTLGVTCTTTATSSSPVSGTYTSSCTASAIPSSTYTSVTYPTGTVQVTPATGLTIAASSGTMTYGGTVPTITAASVTGLAGSDTAASLGTITCSTTATSASPVIVSPYYPSSCSVVDANYSPINYVSGTVQVTPASLTVTANNQSKNYGATLTLGTTAFTTSTLYNGNTVTGVTLTSAGAAAAAAPGTYSIVPSAAAGTGLGNYTINYVNGTLTVSALEITPLNSFGTVNLNGVGLQLITLTNKGTTGFTISGLSITAPGNALADYLTANLSLCPPMIEKLPATLPAGKSCTIGVGIHPTVNIFSPIASTATFMNADTAAGNPHSFPLTALVIDPLASFNASGLSSGKLTFPTTPVSSTNTVSITVTNSGKSQLIFGTPAISGSGDFTVVTGTSTCIGATVQPAGMCVINVKFAPTKSGTFTGTLTINDNANPTVENNPQTISLSGTT